MTKITVKIRQDCNDHAGDVIGRYSTERAARRAAAEALGHADLRGAACWNSTTGMVYQFGGRDGEDRNPTAELIYDGDDQGGR